MNKRLVKQILENPFGRLWTVQGFGKMAANISADSRLHIWDRVLVNPEVPAIHSHASDFRSVVLVGCMRNLRFIEVEQDHPLGKSFNKILSSNPEHATHAFLCELPIEVYGEDAQYKQSAEEVHWSFPDDGTVTLVEWAFGSSSLPMKVYWRGRFPWQDAKPRQATEDEVIKVTHRALALWF